MAKILEIHFEEKLPELSEERKKEIMGKLEEYKDVKLKRILTSKNGIAIEEWEAPSAKRVKSIIEEIMGQDHCDLVIEVDELEI